MNILKNTLKIVLLLLAIPILIGSLYYYSKSKRDRAELWFRAQNLFPQGTVQEQWCFEQALKADPTFAEAWMQKSVSHNKRGHYAEGFRLLDQAVELKPVEYLGYRGYVKLYMLHDYEGAIDDFMRLDTLTPGIRDAPWGEDIYHVLGLAHKQLGEYETARYFFNKSIESISTEQGEDWVDVRTFFYNGLVSFEMADTSEALYNLNKAIDLFDQFTEAHYHKGRILASLNKRGEACTHFRKSAQFFQEGYIYTNSYYELPDQIYLSDIEHASRRYCEAL
jgi:tetratricopeptide (TPR) repeat protein